MATTNEIVRGAQEQLIDISRPKGHWERAVDRAVAELCSRMEIPELQQTETITGGANDGSYDLTTEIDQWSEFDRVVGKPFWDKFPLDFLDKGEFDAYYYDSDIKGTPLYYNIYESELRIAPQPNTGKTIRLPWQKLPQQTADVPDRYRTLLIDMTCQDILPMGETRWMAANHKIEEAIARFQGQIGYKPKAFKTEIYKQARQQIITNINR